MMDLPTPLTQVSPQQQATPTYSSLRTGILSLTPGDSKCKLYCKAGACKYCRKDGFPEDKQDIPGLYSTWITSNILAMSRLLEDDHLQNGGVIDSFHKTGIGTVINLEEGGEHSFCGPPLQSSGFSYQPETLMKNNIFHYNFPLPDYGSCSSAKLLDIVKVVLFALSTGKVAVHCHAGHGRTGMVIAASLMLSKGYDPLQAVAIVREKRISSVQSKEQVEALNDFYVFLHNYSTAIVPHIKCSSISEYIQRSANILSREERRKSGFIPQIVYLCGMEILSRFYLSVDLSIIRRNTGKWRIEFNCSKATGLRVKEEQIRSLACADVKLILDWYKDKIINGMNPFNLYHFLQKEDRFEFIFSFIHLFLSSTFHQLATVEQLKKYLSENRQEGFQPEHDWCWCMFFLLELCSNLPISLHSSLSRLVPSWFVCKQIEDLPILIQQWFSA